MPGRSEPERTAVVRTLAWKEWREQRPIVAAGLGLAALLPFFIMAGSRAMQRQTELTSLADAMPAVFLWIVTPLFAAIAGGACIAHEAGEGTAEFLLSRPASRRRIWCIKVAMAAFCPLAVAAGSLVIAWIFSAAAGSRGDLEAALRPLSIVTRGSPAAEMLLAATFLLFSSSVLFSTFVSRPLTAAAGGIAATCGILALVLALWARVDLVPRLEAEWIGAHVGVIAAAILAASLRTFSRSGISQDGGLRRTASAVSAVALGGLVLFSFPLTYSRTRLDPSGAILMRPVLSPSGDAVISAAMDRGFGSSQVWTIPTDGGGMTRLTGRLTYTPFISPDGLTVGYVSSRGWLGLAAWGAEMRAAGARGEGDRLVASDLSGRIPVFLGDLTFRNVSPSSDSVAWVQDAALRVAPLAGGEERRIELGGTPLAEADVLAWRTDGQEVLLLESRWKGPHRGSVLGAVRVNGGSVRILSHEDSPAMTGLDTGPCAERGLRHVQLLLRRTEAAWELSLVDAFDGSVRRVTESACFARGAFSADGRRLLYAACPSKESPRQPSVLRQLDLVTGADLPVAEVPGRVTAILPSASGDRFLLHRMQGNEPLAPVVLEASGSSRELTAGWVPLGWSGPRRVVLADALYQATRLAVADTDSGDLSLIHPPASRTFQLR